MIGEDLRSALADVLTTWHEHRVAMLCGYGHGSHKIEAAMEKLEVAIADERNPVAKAA